MSFKIKTDKHNQLYVIQFHNACFNDKDNRIKNLELFRKIISIIESIEPKQKIIIYADMNKPIEVVRKELGFLHNLNIYKSEHHNEYIFHNIKEDMIQIWDDKQAIMKSDHLPILCSLNIECGQKKVKIMRIDKQANKEDQILLAKSLKGNPYCFIHMPFIELRIKSFNIEKIIKKSLSGNIDNLMIEKAKKTSYFHELLNSKIEYLNKRNMIKANPKEFYKLLKNLCKTWKSPKILSVVSSKKSNAINIDELRDYLINLYGDREVLCCNLRFDPFERIEIHTIFEKMGRCKRSYAFDGITADFYKELGPLDENTIDIILCVLNNFKNISASDRCFMSRLMMLDKRKENKTSLTLKLTRSITIESFHLAMIEEIALNRMKEEWIS